MDLQTFGTELLKQGLLGLLLLLSLYAIVRLATKYNEIQERRIAEGIANYKIIADLTQAIKDLTSAHRERG